MGGTVVTTHLAGPATADTVAHLNLNESVYPPLPALAEVLSRTVRSAHRYPEFRPESTRGHLAEHLGVGAGQVTVGAGATGVAAAALSAAVREASARGVRHPVLVTPTPTFDGYPILARMAGLIVDGVALERNGRVDLNAVADAVGANTVAVVVCSPHNPTGSVIGADDLLDFATGLPEHVTVIIDQAYIEFADTAPELPALALCHPRMVVVRTFSKAYGLAGLRIGYGVAQPTMASRLQDFEIPFGLCAPAIAAVPVALAAQQELAARVDSMRTERSRLISLLNQIGAGPFPSEANFVFVPGATGVALGSLLDTCGIAVKTCAQHGVRITVGDHTDTRALEAAVRSLIACA